MIYTSQGFIDHGIHGALSVGMVLANGVELLSLSARVADVEGQPEILFRKGAWRSRSQVMISQGLHNRTKTSDVST